MSKLSKFLGCDLHAMNNALSVACIESFGKQGIGHKTPFQMLWLFPTILKKVKKEMGAERLDIMWKKTVEKLRKDKKWQKAIASSHCMSSRRRLQNMKRVKIHANHQQRCENVQLAGLIALTGVSEVRRSCRAISVSAIVRRFNQWAIIEKNKRQEKKVNRVQGSDNDSLYFEYLANFFKQVDEAKRELG